MRLPDPRPGQQRLFDVPEARRRELHEYVQRRVVQMHTDAAAAPAPGGEEPAAQRRWPQRTRDLVTD